MHTPETPRNFLAVKTYERSQSNIRRLRKNLRQDQVVNLAREVIRRIGSRDTALAHVPHIPTADELEAFCEALISDDDTAAARIITAVRADGASADAVYLKHLAAAARMLGEWWTANRVGFAEVTIGTGRMFSIMRGMSHLFVPSSPPQDRFAIFAAAPGETHTMGVRMAADLFRKDGWDIVLELGLDHDALVARIEQLPSSIIGLSIGGRHSLDALSRLVVALHICCPHSPILVSGQNIDEIKPLLSLMAVDGIATDIDEAKEQMDMLWTSRVAVLS